MRDYSEYLFLNYYSKCKSLELHSDAACRIKITAAIAKTKCLQWDFVVFIF